MRKVLVFGSSGFSGQHFISHHDRFMEQNEYELNLADIKNCQDSEISHAFYQIDVTDSKEVSHLIEKLLPDYIVNLVGIFGKHSYDIYHKINVKSTYNILEACRLAGATSKILCIGSAAEYGIPKICPITEDADLNPINLYGLSKKIQTSLIQYYVSNYGLDITIGRPFNLFGEGLSNQLSIGYFSEQIDSAKDGDTILTGRLDSERDYIDIEVAVEDYWLLMRHGKAGDIYNVCSGIPQNMNSILEKMIRKSRKNLNVEIDSARERSFEVTSIFGSPSKINALKTQILN